MKTKSLRTLIKTTVLMTALFCGANLRAVTAPSTQSSVGFGGGRGQLETVAFSDTAEAGMLRRAYRILASGDHDYAGHRVKAMHQVEAAGRLLGMDLAGDLKDHEKQVLSDEKLREASSLISKVLGAAEIKDQKRITKHLSEAIDQINTALSVH